MMRVMMNDANLFDVMTRHRSIRAYKPDPVSDDVLTEILNAGIRASSSGNMQTYSVIVTRDQKLKERLYEPHMKQSMVIDAPVLMTFCADFHRMRRWLSLSDADDGFNNFMSFMIATIDATLVSQNVALAAEAKGLGICYMGSTLANSAQIADILELPEGVVPVVGFSLGYADEDPAPRDRLPLEGLVHYDTYRKYTDEDILNIYKDREQKGWDRYMSNPRLKELVEKNNVKNLAQLYSQVKYTTQTHKTFSQTVLNLLKQQDFFTND